MARRRSTMNQLHLNDDERARYAELTAADEDGDLSLEELDGVAAGLGISSILCGACPVSSFSSVSN
jgi:hypothetical protein